MTSTIKPQGEGYTPITDGNSGPLHYLSARQLLTAWRKQLSGYQPGDENWTEQDQQAFDAIYDGSLFGDDVVTLTDTVKPKAEQGLFARIKKSSKYYSQGLNTKGQPCVFPVRIRQPRSSGDWAAWVANIGSPTSCSSGAITTATL